MANVKQRLQHPETLDVDGDVGACALIHSLLSCLVVVGYRTTRPHTGIGVLRRPVLTIRPSCRPQPSRWTTCYYLPSAPSGRGSWPARRSPGSSDPTG